MTLLPKSILLLLLLSPLTQASGQRGSRSFFRARAAISPEGATVAANQTSFLDSLPPFWKRLVRMEASPTVSHIASVSKAFAATAVGELVAEGKVDWDTTPVSQYLPEFQLKDPVLTSQLTFADLLSHRTPVPYIDIAWFRNEQPRRELIKQLRYLDMPSKLPREVNYHNTMYAVAGEAAANVAGLSYSELIKDAKNGIYEEGYMDPIPVSDAPAGDIYMNVVDLAKWGRVILKEGELDGKQVLDKASVQETLKPHNIYSAKARRPELAPTAGYGFGWVLDSYRGHTIMHHGGANPGYRSMVAFFPDDDLVVSILTNAGVTELPSLLPYYIADGILGSPQTVDWLGDQVLNRTKYIYDLHSSIENGNLPERIEGKPHNHALVDYTGEYTHPVFGKIVVTLQEDGSLFMKVRTLESKLEHYHYESFKGYVQDFSIRGKVFFTFFTGSNGRVESLEAALVMASEPEMYKKTESPK
ncbi:MAG: beta-lactamase/transpeptidase-like protein [Linnemannia elongata]|nr:MAG: beta-lactamase/transpeptidase-like protein [Linnemannia elongata]